MNALGGFVSTEEARVTLGYRLERVFFHFFLFIYLFFIFLNFFLIVFIDLQTCSTNVININNNYK